MFFKNRKILIIGGTGTIGQSLVKEILVDQPKVVRIFSRDEYKQFVLKNKLSEYSNMRYLIGDVRNYDRILNAMEDIDYVFHVAALKHVESCEYNPYEAVLTNIIGTNNVIKAAKAQKVKKVIFTSSDKAISPTNIYGATKLVAEKMIVASENNKGSRMTSFSMVRFGNVMGSRGSVVPLFVDQIINNRKITVTDENMSRFIMSINQATKLTIKAMKKAEGGEIFVLKMPVIKLKDLITVIIEQTCKKHSIDEKKIEIQYIGLRPGEKRYEELMTYDESLTALELSDMFIIPSKKDFNYSNAKKAKVGIYSSDNQEIISIEELNKLIIDQKLI
ncbi:polysaccharide biosynthesis protein [Clostridiaceae bacterium M8S5]|nr:polysaccharide biosynthesis protein [Clostridiaceae bacterium M8S5]